MFQGGSKGATGRGKILESGSGSDLSGNKGQIGGTNFAGAKNVTLNTTTTGISSDALTTLLGSFAAPAPNYSTAPAPAPSPAPAPAPDASSNATTDATGSLSKWVAGLGATGLLILGVILFLVFKKS